jgi:hypothetical protein
MNEQDLLNQLQRAHDHLWDFRRRLSYQVPVKQLKPLDDDIEALRHILERVEKCVKGLPKVKSTLPQFKPQAGDFWAEHHRHVRAKQLKEKIKGLRKELQEVTDD